MEVVAHGAGDVVELLLAQLQPKAKNWVLASTSHHAKFQLHTHCNSSGIIMMKKLQKA